MEHVLRDGRPRAVFELLGDRFTACARRWRGGCARPPPSTARLPASRPTIAPPSPTPFPVGGGGRDSSRGLACPAVIPTPAAA